MFLVCNLLTLKWLSGWVSACLVSFQQDLCWSLTLRKHWADLSSMFPVPGHYVQVSKPWLHLQFGLQVWLCHGGLGHVRLDQPHTPGYQCPDHGLQEVFGRLHRLELHDERRDWEEARKAKAAEVCVHLRDVCLFGFLFAFAAVHF